MSYPNIQTMVRQYPPSKIDEQTKVREVLQQAALLGLERHGFFEKAAFYGGTALRILYGLDRFSEDLDFTLLKSNPSFDFTPYLEGMNRELTALGFQLQVTQKVKSVETSILSAFMKMNTIELYLAIGQKERSAKLNHNAKVQIKLEVDIDPPPHFRIENRLVTTPTSFYVLSLQPSDLFAGKMHAILYRSWKGRIKGRDWFDLLWYIQKGIPLSLRYLESCMHQAGNLSRQETLSKIDVQQLLKEKIQQINWENAKEDVRIFIADPERLAIWSSQFFTDVIEHIQFEENKR